MSLKVKIKESTEQVSDLFTKSNLSFIFLIVFVVGIFTTETHRAISTIGIIGLALVSILNINKNTWREGLQNKEVLLLSLVLILPLLDGVLTDFLNNLNYLEGRIMIKLPFLIMPLSILFLPKLSEKRYHLLILVFVLCSAYIAINATIFYLAHPEEVLDLYLRSKTIPLPLNHVRFSLILSLAIFLGAYLVYKKAWFLHPLETKIYLALSLFLFIFLHLLSVRSGLLAFYLLALFVAFFVAWKTKKYKLIGMALGAFILIPLASYFAIGTFRNKVKNTIEDINNTKYEYYANFHSLTARVFSYKVAYALIKEKPIMGVGIGNLEREVNLTYIRKFSEIRPEYRLIPHNQFMYYLTAFGFLGTLIFCVGFYGILYFKKYRNNIVLLAQFLIVSISFLFESTLETQLGANFSLSFLLIPLYYLISQDDRKEESNN